MDQKTHFFFGGGTGICHFLCCLEVRGLPSRLQQRLRRWPRCAYTWLWFKTNGIPFWDTQFTLQVQSVVYCGGHLAVGQNRFCTILG